MCVDQKSISIFWSIIKLHFQLTEKTFNLQLTKGIIDQKFPTFNVHIYPYKMSIFLCYEKFLSRTFHIKFPIMYKVLRFLVTKVHNVSRGPVWKFIYIQSMQCLQFRFTKFLYIFNHTKCTFILYIFRLTKCTMSNCI